jgi:hypothetical protein
MVTHFVQEDAQVVESSNAGGIFFHQLAIKLLCFLQAPLSDSFLGPGHLLFPEGIRHGFGLRYRSRLPDSLFFRPLWDFEASLLGEEPGHGISQKIPLFRTVDLLAPPRPLP